MNVAQDVIVRIQGLNKTFRGRAGTVVALNGIDLDIYRGEIFGIIGLSGAGHGNGGRRGTRQTE